jgi:CRISPR system Cascade subunit CasA
MDRWIPVARHDGSLDRIAPWQITDRTPENPVVGLDAPRADFTGALVQLLIGVVQTACPPQDDRDWAMQFQHPPSPATLRSKVAGIAEHFNLADPATPFMQVADLADGVAWPVAKLFLEQPGNQTLDQNRDLFQRRGTITGLCPACAAAALYTLQCTGPAGGGGHLTGIRGGGPLTCLVTGATLWETVWLNVLNEPEFAALGNAERADPAGMFPWVPPVRAREAYPTTTPADVHPANLYWGMPRRILLDEPKGPGVCSVCGEETPARITGFTMKKWGVNYAGAWRHPLSPYYPKGDDWLPEHANPGGIQYKHWLGLVQSDPARGTAAPLAVQAFRRRWPRVQDLLPEHPMLWSSGYDMDNSKARCWYEGMLPLTYVPGDRSPVVEGWIAQVVGTADLVRYSTATAVRSALSSPRAKTRPPAPAEVSARFWRETDSLFYAVVADLIGAADEPAAVAAKRRWLTAVTRVAESLFAYYSQAVRIGDVEYPQRIAEAHRDLRTFTAPGNKKLRETLGLPEEKTKKETENGTPT